MLRHLLAAVAAAVVVSSASAQVIVGPAVVISRPVVVHPQPLRPQPAVGLAAVNSPFWFGTDFGVGGPGYQFRGYPPYNGWSSGYRGAYYGEPVPGAAFRRRR
jgi:opacity protein-like surface antigen